MSGSAKPKRPRLGRGLSSLIINSSASDEQGAYVSEPTAEPPSPEEKPSEFASSPENVVRQIPTRDISPNPYQPRREFDPQELNDLAESIRQQGILQPLIVATRQGDGDSPPYVLIAGERRLRAARDVPLDTVPCIVRQATGRQMLEWALIENIQRTDLNPIERAEAYRSYIDRFQLTHAAAAERLGQARTTVSNYLRLLDLDGDIQAFVASGTLSFGHAKVIAGLIGQRDRQAALADRVIQEGLSVRRLEELASESTDRTPAGAETPARAGRSVPPYIRDLEAQLSQAIGTRVSIRPGRAKNSGRVVVEYYSLDDFERIAGVLGAELES